MGYPRAQLSRLSRDAPVSGERMRAPLWDAVRRPRSTDALSLRVRLAFDPSGILNPGIWGPGPNRPDRYRRGEEPEPVGGANTLEAFRSHMRTLGIEMNDAPLSEVAEMCVDGVLRDEFWQNVTVPGTGAELNQSLEKAGRVADFLEFSELICLDALTREESCGGHFREEYQDAGEAKRNDEKFAFVSAWEYAGPGKAPILNKEPLEFENVHLSTRSYK